MTFLLHFSKFEILSFSIKINDANIYSLVKEEVDYDPTKTEVIKVLLSVNN